MFSVVILAARRYCAPSDCAPPLRSGVNDSKNHRDGAISTESLQIPGNQYKPTSGNELWMEMKCMYLACLPIEDVIYSLIEISFPSWLVEFATWHVWYCMLWYTVIDYSQAVTYISWDDMFWRNISSHILWLQPNICLSSKKVCFLCDRSPGN